MRKNILLLFVILIMIISSFAVSSCNASSDRSESDNKANSTQTGTSAGQAEAKGILSVDVNENGELILAFTDGTSVNLGVVTGSKVDKSDKDDSGSIEDAKYIIASGNTGDNIEWVIDNFHVLTFSGEGKMKEYYTGSSYNPNKVIPWHAYDGFVEKVVIEEGITSICRFAFLSFYNCSEFIIPETVKEIGYCAFEYSGVKDLSFWPKSVAIINKPEKELRGFTKVYLAAGESKEVKIAVNKADLAYYNVKEKRYVTEGGEYELQLCPDSESVKLSETVTIASFWFDNLITDFSSLATTSTRLLICILLAIAYAVAFLLVGDFVDRNQENS